ncbi:MAG TPA: hypothetical protein VFB38_25325 [Chthonomonadaceae bacterium]|nr:hypothetical protein [Chthonomonadaceae bacterium]
MLQECVAAWGARLRHIFDRGFAGSPWLGLRLENQVGFVLRGPKGWSLQEGQGRVRKAWQRARGKRSWQKQLRFDARWRCQRLVGGGRAGKASRLSRHASVTGGIAPRQAGNGSLVPADQCPQEKAEAAWKTILA